MLKCRPDTHILMLSTEDLVLMLIFKVQHVMCSMKC